MGGTNDKNHTDHLSSDKTILGIKIEEPFIIQRTLKGPFFVCTADILISAVECGLNCGHTTVNVFIWSAWNLNDEQQRLNDKNLKDMSTFDSVVGFLCSLSCHIFRMNRQTISSFAASNSNLVGTDR